MNSLLPVNWTISESVVERLGWVLIHSMWQLALVGLLAGITVHALRRSTAGTRYFVLVLAMTVAVAFPAATWLLQDEVAADRLSERTPPTTMSTVDLAPSHSAQNNLTGSTPVLASDVKSDAKVQGLAGSEVVRPVASAPSSPTAVSIPGGRTWSEMAHTLLRPWLDWIVVVWILGVVLCSLRPLLGWHMLRRLRREGISPVSEDVRTALRRVSQRLGVRYAVSVMQSTVAQVPVVVGYLRPMILLPVSLLTSIPPAQLEAILAHELVHVRRHDFVVNLLQTLIETLFFYHPAVWWLSHQIRVEREHCCDDAVVVLLGNRVEYGRALLAIEELRGRSTLLAPGATDGSLISRLRRIVGATPSQAVVRLRDRWPVALITLSLLLILACGTFVSSRAQEPPPKPKVMLEPIAGEVVDAETGKPIEGATVRFRFIKHGPEADAEQIGKVVAELVFRNVGEFTFEIPDAANEHSGLFIERTAEHPDYQSVAPSGQQFKSVINNAPSHARNFIRKIEMKPGKAVTGRVLDLDGRPAKNVTVTSGRDRQGWQNASVHKTTTDPEGRYRLIVPTNFGGGRVYVIPDHAAAVSRAIATDSNEQPDFRLQRGTRLHGQVLDSLGRGVAGAVVRANGGERIPWRYTLTDAAGKYSLPPCQYGEYKVELLDEGQFPDTKQRGVRLPGAYMAHAVSLPKTAPTEQVLDFKPAETVRLMANYRASDGTPVVGSKLSVFGAMKHVPWHGTMRDVSGQPGKYEVHVPRGLEQVHIDQTHDYDGNGEYFLRIVRQSTTMKEAVGNGFPQLNRDDDSLQITRFKAARLTWRATFDGKPQTEGRHTHGPKFSDAKAARKLGAVAATGIGVSLLVDGSRQTTVHPGIDIELRFEASGFEPWHEIIRFKEGEERTIELKLVANAEAKAEPNRNAAAQLPVAMKAAPAFDLPDHLNVMSVGFDRESKHLVTVSTEHDVRIRTWDILEKKLKQDVKLDSELHGNRFLSSELMLSADRQRVIAAPDGEVGIWDVATGKLVKMLKPSNELEGARAHNLACSADLSVIACGQAPAFSGFGSGDVRAFVWDVASGKITQTVSHKNAVQIQSIALSHDGKLLATGGQRTGICVWDVGTGEQLYALNNANPNHQHPDPEVKGEGVHQVLCLAFSPDGKRLAYGDMLSVKVVEAQSGKPIHRLEAPFRFGHSRLMYSKDGQILARYDTDKVVKLWSASTGTMLAELPTGSNGASFSDDGRWFAVGFSDQKNAVAVWQLRDEVAAVDPVPGVSNALAQIDVAPFRPHSPGPTEITFEKLLTTLRNEAQHYRKIEYVVEESYVPPKNPPEGLRGARGSVSATRRFVRDGDRSYYKELRTFEARPGEAADLSQSTLEQTVNGRWWRRVWQHTSGGTKPPEKDMVVLPDSRHPIGRHMLLCDVAENDSLPDLFSRKGVVVDVLGEESIGQDRCVKVRMKYSESVEMLMWLALNKNMLPIRREVYMHAGKPASLAYLTLATEFKEIAPGVWFTTKVIELDTVKMPGQDPTDVEPEMKLRLTSIVRILGVDPVFDLALFDVLGKPPAHEPPAADVPLRQGATTNLQAGINLVAPDAANPAGNKPVDPKPTPLAEAIEKFNAQSKSDPIGKDQPPLTEKEVLDAIRFSQKNHFPEVTDAIYSAFQRIAETKELPPKAEFDVLNLIDDGANTISDAWFVRLGLPKEEGGMYYFSIRKQLVRSRTAAEEADRVEKVLQETPALPGRVRLEDRVKELRSRAQNAQQLGALSGRFVFDGTPPPRRDLYPTFTKIEPASRQEKGPDGRYSGVEMIYREFLKQGIRPKTEDPTLPVGKDGGVANILVWVVSKDIPWTPAKPAEQGAVTIRLKDGNFVPRVSVMTAGQQLRLVNDDPVEFSFHMDLMRNSAIAAGMRAKGAQPLTWTLPLAEKFPLAFRSGIGPWATGLLFVHANPYVAVSQEDGSFTIPNLPPGDWEFRAWHERRGYLENWPKGFFKQTIKPGENQLGTIKLKPEFLIKDLEFLAQYPRLQTLSLDMTEEKFLAICVANDVKWRKTVMDGGVRYRIPTGDGHTVVVMFAKTGEKCTGIQRIRGEESPDVDADKPNN